MSKEKRSVVITHSSDMSACELSDAIEFGLKEYDVKKVISSPTPDDHYVTVTVDGHQICKVRWFQPVRRNQKWVTDQAVGMIDAINADENYSYDTIPGTYRKYDTQMPYGFKMTRKKIDSEVE